MKANRQRFKGSFPGDEATNGIYAKFKGAQKNAWGAGYWIGIHWLLYQMTSDEIFKETAYQYVETYTQTLTHEHYELTHCVGCEADPALVWGYKFTGDSYFKNLITHAADIMLDRFVPTPGIMHMAGAMDDATQNKRVIVDSLTVIPILKVATDISGNPAYAEAAVQNGETVLRYNVCNDGAIIQLAQFDPILGRYAGHLPHQGLNLQSTWSRGSGWAAWGLPDLYRLTGSQEVLYGIEQVVRYYVNALPNDLVPYWDLFYREGSQEPRDSSAAALVSAGIQKFLKLAPDHKSTQLYSRINDAILASLIQTCWEEKDNIEGLLAHVCANRPRNRTLDDYALWGDYYFVEALYYKLGGELY
ncbi:unsaturated chondroitin disaccharide hydrolase [Paenibacillus sp. V4I3]|nr:glycoside hydrolase family 88 protein [Paenibacillus sp. V4I3]MDQ0874629.1 unsaturated chondroitin disaccharide hydrolase [Paenibacillus sp. V4I3]